MQWVVNMVYVCDNCGARFSRTGQLNHCPDCGTNLLHPANQVEQHEYLSQVAELLREKFGDGSRCPNAVMTEILLSSCFSFKLPAAALRIDDPMVVEISVDYGEDTRRNELAGNVWARQENGKTMEFLMSVYLPVRPDETPQEQVGRIFSALNGNERFRTALSSFISERLKCQK